VGHREHKLNQYRRATLFTSRLAKNPPDGPIPHLHHAVGQGGFTQRQAGFAGVTI